MLDRSNFDDEENYYKIKKSVILHSKPKDKHMSYIDTIPEQYKRKDYIIDKLNCKKKNVEK